MINRSLTIHMLLPRTARVFVGRTASRCLNTATPYKSHTIPHHESPAREAYPKIPNHESASPASTASPASAVAAQNVQSPPTIDPRIAINQSTTSTSTTGIDVNASRSATEPKNIKPPRARRPRKQVLTLTEEAIYRLRDIQSRDGKMIKISVVAKGCAGGAYKLEYVDKAERFDEIVEQDDVKVLVDSKSLMKIIGSEMDFEDDVLSSRFTFRNPNVVSTCGCEESFATKEDEERLLGAGGQKF